MKWELSWRADPAGAALADRHYNRQSHGHKQFVPPGRCLVLITPDKNAVWVTHWPHAKFVKHQWAGAWMNTLFRNEGAGLSSELIVDAVAATLAWWPTVPKLGMVTFVDASQIRHKRDPGRCYRRAGFVAVGQTKSGLIALQLTPERMPKPRPALHIFTQQELDYLLPAATT